MHKNRNLVEDKVLGLCHFRGQEGNNNRGRRREREEEREQKNKIK